MNDRSAKPRQAMTATEKGRPQSGEYPRTSNVDDEFHEFFNKGDIGEYEGGVAYSQPPSRVLPEVDEQIVITDPARQRARRAFFGRVVAIIVAACVVLLVTAARFKPQDIRKVGENDTRIASGQIAEAEEVKLFPPPKEQPHALPLVPAVAAAVSAVPQEGAKISDLPAAETARPQAKQMPSTTTTSAKVSGGSGASVQPAKSKATATREAPPPAPVVSKTVKESVGAFPVD